MSDGLDLASARHAGMRWNSPLSDQHAAALLDQLTIPVGSTVLDLGCGWGQLLLRAVAKGGRTGDERTTGVGVDTDVAALARARELAAARGQSDDVTFTEADAESWHEPADRVLCLGASHAWGGTRPALAGLRHVVAPGGRVLFGDGCWERQPSADAAAIFPEVLSLTEIAQGAVASGWRVLDLSTSDQREWDEFESSWRRGREDWLVENPDRPEAAATRAELNARLVEYVATYRGVLGFSFLILGR